MNIDMDQFRGACPCGRAHEILVDDIVIEKGALKRLPEYLEKEPYRSCRHLVITADEHTYAAAGEQVAALLPQAKTIVLAPENLHADEKGVARFDAQLKEVGDVDLFIAVGSGTIHDLTRYHAYNMKVPFFSVPTAASVDGFVSTVAAMTWHGFKKSFTAVSPVVVLADTDVFKAAPQRLTASGVGDLLGKYTALADWKIAHVLTGEYICDRIVEMEYQALDSLIKSLDGLNEGSDEAYEMLMYGLLLSGLAMQMTGNSRPASGAEHHMSHLWEMEVYNDHLDFLHGEKVGVGLVLASDIYHKAAAKLRQHAFYVKARVPLEEAAIRQAFRDPVLCEAILKENTPNLLDTVDPTKLEAETDAIVRIIETIPQSEELAALLARVHGVHSLADMGLYDSFYHKMAFLSPYVRQRLTFMRTLKFYDFYDEVTTP